MPSNDDAAPTADDDGSPVDRRLLAADADRAEPDVASADLESLVRGTNDFALELFRRLAAAKSENLFASPYSVSLALAMTWAGARGETAAAMADALAFPHEGESLHAAFNALSRSLEATAENGGEAGEFTLEVANAIWGQDGYPFDDGFLETLARNYGAGLRAVDFAADPGPAREEINDWVAEETAGKIDEVLPEGSIDEDARLVVTTAIYFLASWAHRFDEADTEDGTFTALDGTESTVPMMHRHLRTQYAAVDGHQVLALPYEGDATMVVVLPAAGEFAALRDSLDADRFAALLEATVDASGDLAFPRFAFESSIGLRDALSALGMDVAFTERADFTGMVEPDESAPPLVLEDVYHDAYVAVDEAGTEAAAATGATMRPTSMPRETFDVTVDRPFCVAIRDDQTGCLLFLGQVVDAGAAQ